MEKVEEIKQNANKCFFSANYKEAIELYGKALLIESNNFVIYSNRAQCYLKIQKFQDAFDDCILGLKTCNDQKLKIKLNYRAGIALKGLNKTKEALLYFKNVLEFDPENKASLNEIKKFSTQNIKPNNKFKNTNNEQLEINEVDNLPMNYKMIVDNLMKKSQQIIQTFETKKNLTNENNFNDFNENTFFNSNLSIHFLLQLKSIPEKYKFKAYIYVINVKIEKYLELFNVSGIEVEFLDFFFESISYLSSNNSIENWPEKFLEYLINFSKLKRFHLSLLLVEKKYINNILINVEKFANYKILNKYKLICM